MVWGMTLPEGFGEFSPMGDLENDDWASRLNRNYWALGPDEKKAIYDFREGGPPYAYFVSAKFKNEIGTSIAGSQPLTPIQAHEAPQSLDTRKGYASLGSLIMLESKLLAVDDSLKAIIEKIEPNLHQFLPLAVKMPKGKIYPQRYFTLVVGRYLDAFSSVDSAPKAFTERSPGRFVPFPSNGLAFRREVFAGTHLWRDRSFREDLLCFSDELKGQVDKAGLRIPKLYKLKEI